MKLKTKTLTDKITEEAMQCGAYRISLRVNVTNFQPDREIAKKQKI